MSDDAKFEAWLGQSFAGLRKEPCPDASILSGFLAKELPAERRKLVERHIAACGYCDLVVARMESFESAVRRDRRAHWRPLFAAAAIGMIAALGYPAYRMLQPRPVVDLVSSADSVIIDSPQVLHLDTTRSITRRAPSAGRSSELALSFFIPVETAHHYDAVIRNRAAVAVLQREGISSDETGNCLLTFKRGSLAAGEYTLVVTDRESPSQKFQFAFEL